MSDQMTAGVCGGQPTPAVIAPEQRRAQLAASHRRRTVDERGAVTAETAVVLPLLIGIALGLVWLVALAATQVRVVDGAREAARLAARGESTAEAVAAGRTVAPPGTLFEVRRVDGKVVVHAIVGVRGPGGLFRFLPLVSVQADAVASEEPE